ncbi:hypothetical protein SALBM217S_09086 [Streptomyces griseoloalbus]
MRDPLSVVTDAFTSFLFGKVETTRLPVRTSTGQAQAVYLPTAAPGLGDSGVIIGREVYSGKGYIYDPFQLYGQPLSSWHGGPLRAVRARQKAERAAGRAAAATVTAAPEPEPKPIRHEVPTPRTALEPGPEPVRERKTAPLPVTAPPQEAAPTETLPPTANSANSAEPPHPAPSTPLAPSANSASSAHPVLRLPGHPSCHRRRGRTGRGGPRPVLTSNPALWEETKDGRAKLVPTHLYDPTNRCETPARLHWSPISGCGTRNGRRTRRRPARPVARSARPGRQRHRPDPPAELSARRRHRRPYRPPPPPPGAGHPGPGRLRILRTHSKAAPGAAGELEATLTAYPERRDIAQLTTRALSALSTVNVREACTPDRTDALSHPFVQEGGTLYVVGESIEDPRTRPGAMPLLTALTSAWSSTADAWPNGHPSVGSTHHSP